MEHQLWKSIVAILGLLDKERPSTRFGFSDERIVQVYYWSVIHDRPVSWAVQRRNWPIHLRRNALPSNSTMSRRLPSSSVRKLLDALEQRVLPPKNPGLFWTIDGKPLVIGGASKDRQAGYGRAARGKARGYKIHAIVSHEGIAAWRVAPMNMDERTMAARLLRSTTIEGYLVADSNYDSNPLHDVCDRLGNLQLITPRRFGKSHGLGHHRHSPSRLRSIERIENPFADFGDGLLHDRDLVERTYANLVNWGGGLANLPSWVRTHRRVNRWVQAKLILTTLRRRPELTSYVA
jgi:Transposase DDE domain